MFKKTLLASLLVSTTVTAQTYPSPTYNNLTVLGSTSLAGGTLTGSMRLYDGSNYLGKIYPANGYITMSPGMDRYYDNFSSINNPSKLYRQQNITCTFTNGSAVVTGCSSTSGAVVGNFLQEQTVPTPTGSSPTAGTLVNPIGTTFPAATKIASGITGTGFTMSANALITGVQTVSIVTQCGNAAFIFTSQNNGLIGDGYEMGAIGMSNPGNSCQGFESGTRTGAAGNTIGYGALYREASFLQPAGAYQYMNIVDRITHNANADWLPNQSWKPFYVDGQTGDISWSRPAGIAMSMTAATGYFNMPAALSVGTAGQPKSALDVGAGGVAIGASAGTNTAPANGLLVSGSAGFGTVSPISGVPITAVGTAAIHGDCIGTNDAYSGFVISGQCNVSTSGIRYTWSGVGATVMSYNNIDGGIFTTDGSAVTLKVGTTNATSGLGTIVAKATATSMTLPGYLIQGQTKFTTSGCSVSATTGSGTAGTYTSGTTGTCTVVITMNGATGMTAPNGWYCSAFDRTTPADIQGNTTSSTTTCTISGTTVSGDVIAFAATPY